MFGLALSSLQYRTQSTRCQLCTRSHPESGDNGRRLSHAKEQDPDPQAGEDGIQMIWSW